MLTVAFFGFLAQRLLWASCVDPPPQSCPFLGFVDVGKRSAPGSARQTKQRKANVQFAKFANAENQAEFGDDLADIIKELMDNPAKIKNCKRAVLADTFDPNTLESIASRFAPSVTYMSRVPKDFLKAWLPRVTDLSEANLKTADNQDRGSCVRALCRQCQVDPATPNPWMARRDFQKEMGSRSELVGTVEYEFF